MLHLVGLLPSSSTLRQKPDGRPIWRDDKGHSFDTRKLVEDGLMRKFLEANGARISIPDDPNFESEGEAIESGLRRTIEVVLDVAPRSSCH
jgi:hypothetical protein